MNSASRPTRLLLLIGALAAVVLLSAAGGATAARLITGKDVKDGSLTGKDIKDGSVKKADLAGPIKRTLDAATVSDVHQVSIQSGVTASSDYYGSTFASVPCGDGEVAISGGYDLPTSSTEVAVFRNRPSADGTAWEVALRSTSSTFVGTFYALCATVG
ncbi:hypothetical protein [Nocardioides acrostichi]|uniref:SipW-cognate class signal peptide n=1 Tax=Nocardioides acrostichi TaxID=2784339 RepID=A0A930Y926_9ACTN|nr:hypothetical protein [Nocardioides acrostichi]MBF4163686.1 hypothetical protein [Nocardioides acrostichi]